MVKRKKINLADFQKFIYGNFKISLDYVKKIKNYIWFSLVLFLVVGIFGYLFPVFFEEQILNLIAGLIEETEGLGTLGLIRFIFINNLKSSFFAMILGIFFGIIPVAVAVINGYILGFVANKALASEGVLVLWRLLPHGVFEIPAIMISVGLGLKLGSFLFVFKERNKWKEFRKWLIDVLRVFVFVVIPLLILAAIIEGILICLLG